MNWKRLRLWIAMAVFASACAGPDLVTPTPVTVSPAFIVSPTFTPNPTSPVSSPTPVPVTVTSFPTLAPFVPDGPVIKPIPAGRGFEIRYIKMFDNLNGWAITTWMDSADHLLRTADGGWTWYDVTPPESPAVGPGMGKMALPCFLDPLTAWVVYSNADDSLPQQAATVWFTRDGGATWRAGQGIVPDQSWEFFAPAYIDFVDSRNGWLLVSLGAGMNHVYSALYHTTDGGQNWVPLITPYDDGGIQACAKTGMDFISETIGWLVIDCHGVAPVPYIFSTIDGGRTWSKIDLLPPPDRPEIFGDSFCGAYHPTLANLRAGIFLLMCQKYGGDRAVSDYLYRTADGGSTWQVIPFPGGTPVLLYDQTLYAIGRTIRRSDDGGSTWVEVGTVNWDPQVSFVDRNTAWAVASKGGEYALVKTIDGCSSWKLLRTQIAP
jgi:photosystem II stability/assembly factor-like uncharacterized protein